MKLNLAREWASLYSPSAKQVQVVDVPPLQFAMVDGQIEPGQAPESSPVFQEALAALYGISYTLKFMSKQRPTDPIDYTVMPLEALWWTETGACDITKPEGWRWRAMILQPAHITTEMFQAALSQLRKKKPGPALDLLRLETFHEGLSLQIMHIGPYAAEPATLEKMRAYAQEHGYRYRGQHHEIYLGDPRRTAPKKLRTILRQPVESIVE